MDVNFILQELKKIDEALKCILCTKKCVEPVRIKTCDHYFCLICFKTNSKDHMCPKCHTFYEEREIDYDNIAKQSDYLLQELKEFLLEPDPVTSIKNECPYTVSSNFRILPENSFVYDNKTFHLNYIDDLGNKINPKGESPLHIACKKKKLDEVIRLLEKKCDLNLKDFAGWAPLHEAIESTSVEIVEILLQNGALVDIPGGEYVSPLHKAVTLQNINIIKLLLKYNANQEAVDYFGKKPVDCTQNEAIMKVLTEDIDRIDKIQELFCKKKINVFHYFVEDSYKQKLMKSKLVRVVREYDAKKVTHFLIRRTHKLSIKIMKAMLDGCFLLPQEWIDEFLKNNYFVDIPNYIFISKPEINDGIRKAMLNSILNLPKLFDGISFFVHGHAGVVEIRKLRFTKDSICSLITSGGGKILHRAPTPSTCESIYNYPYHSNLNGRVSRCCHYLIYEENSPPALQYQMAEIKHKSSVWLIDCIIKFSISD